MKINNNNYQIIPKTITSQFFVVVRSSFFNRNAGKPMKCSKDFHSCLVSNRNLSQKFHPVVWAQGRWPEPNLAHFWCCTRKVNIQNFPFFYCNLEDSPMFWAFEQLSSTIAWWDGVHSGRKTVQKRAQYEFWLTKISHQECQQCFSSNNTMPV